MDFDTFKKFCDAYLNSFSLVRKSSLSMDIRTDEKTLVETQSLFYKAVNKN